MMMMIMVMMITVAPDGRIYLSTVHVDIAASPYGRELLMTKDSGRHVVDVFLNAVYNIPPKVAGKLKK